MRSGRQKKNILTILILVCFSIYAISPLVRTFQVNSTKPVRGEIEQPAVKIYVIQFLLFDLFDDDTDGAFAEQDDPSEGHFLIKKKKAVLSEKNLRPIMSLDTVATVSSDADGIEASIQNRLCLPPAALHTAQYLMIPLHSGNAPPSA